MFQVMPPLSAEDYAALKADIEERGVMVPIEVDDEGNVLDGHHRAKICAELAIPCPRVVRSGFADDASKRTHARRLNIARRHLRGEQKRALIEEELKDDPARSNRQIASALGVDDKTVGVVRDSLQERAEIPHLERAIGADGKAYPSKKPPRPIIASFDFDGDEDGQKAIKRSASAAAGKTREKKREETRAKLDDLATRQAKEAQGVYDVIVLDPPWPMGKIERDERPNQSDFDYPTMTEEELATLPIPSADACHVWCWTTQKFLPMAFRLLEKWGLRYVCTFVWRKPGGFQPYNLPQYNCEFALYARKGSPPDFLDTKDLPVCFDAPRGRHSEKPAEFYDMVRRVTAGRRLDMFNRRQIDGFDGWGNESA